MDKKDNNKILYEIFDVLAPGKPLRKAVDIIQEARLGALIVLCDPTEIQYLIEGGFEIDTEFSPQKIYELSKMDGGIIISKDISRIYGANLHLQPNHNIKTEESGTRHRTANRIAKQTGNMVVTISERRNKITVFSGEFKYVLDSIADLLMKSSQSIMSLEKYAASINNYLNNLNYLEYEKLVTTQDIVGVIRIFLLLFKTNNNIEYYIRALGVEGKTLALQKNEIMLNQKSHFINLIKDYSNEIIEKEEQIIDEIEKIDITQDEEILKLLSYDPKQKSTDDVLVAKGYRLLSSINKLNKKDVELIIQNFMNINDILSASYDDLIEIKGINKIKGSAIMRTKERYKDILELEKI